MARRRSLALFACALAACERSPLPMATDAVAPVVTDAVADAITDAITDAGASTPLPLISRCAEGTASERMPGFTGPSAEVEVIRDALGIPHIDARTDRDAFFASGYAQATDRLFQMELIRRTARGTLSEIVGRERLEQDRIVRLMGVSFWGRQSAARVRAERPDTDALIDAWTAGVNRRVREVVTGVVPRPPGFRPSEFDFLPSPWTVEDAYIVGRLILFRNANQLDFDILGTLVQRYAPAAEGLPFFQSLTGAFVVPAEERPAPRMARRLPRDAALRLARWNTSFEGLRRGASNNWAVAARHSANGRPLLAGDPHQPLQSPNVLWAQHLRSAEANGFDVAGFAFVGAPGVHLGHNRRVAWTATTAYPDMMDLWAVDADENAIVLGGRSLPLRRCEETITVRGAEAVRVPIEEVPGYGVLLPNSLFPLPVTRSGQRVLFGWTGFRPTLEAAVFFDLDRAADLDDFHHAVGRMEIGAFNFIAADAREIDYRAQALVPDRGDPRTMRPSHLLLDGSEPRTLWTGALLEAARQPASRGGTRGFLVSANNDPFGFTSNGRTDDDPFYYGVWFDPGTRAARLESELTRLTAAGGVTVEQMQALQLDTHNPFADEVLPPLFAAWGRRATDPALATFRDDPELAPLVDLLSQWDRHMRAEAAAPVAFEAFISYLGQRALGDELGPFFAQVHSREPTYTHMLAAQVVNRRFPEADRFVREGRDLVLLRALADTRSWLRTRFGDTSPGRYRWRDLHRTRLLPPFERVGPFDGGSLATNGSVGTVNVSQAPFFDRDGMPRMFHESRSGAVYRMVVGFEADGTPRATVNFSRGNSGDPTSPWWSNLDGDWLAGTYRPIPFRRDEVLAAMRERSLVTP